jgi:adenosylcobinamide-phosphate synthase
MTVLLAMALDRLFGEPPARLHPVVWIGRYLDRAGRGLTALPPRRAFFAGASYWMLGAIAFVAIYALAEIALNGCPLWLRLLGVALLLKPLFALRLLIDEVQGVEAALRSSLADGRTQLSRIVSRDTARLSPAAVRESALESLSENLSDSVVAPLFWYALLGLPGAALYRFANTADAAWGYRGPWEWAGKWAARADDVLSFVPARLTAAMLFVVSATTQRNLAALATEARKTPSPNSGWPMSALALGLGVRLGKPDVYVLNPSGREPGAIDLQRGTRRAALAGWAFACLVAVGIELGGGFGHG